MSENSHPNMSLQPLSKNASWSEYIQNKSFTLFPEKKDWRKRLVFTLLEWAQKDTSLDMIGFIEEMKLFDRKTLYRWEQKYPDIKEGLEMARLLIASRHYTGALTRKLDKDVAFKDMHRLDSEWLEINKYHADLKKDETHQPCTFIIRDDKPKIISKEELADQVKAINATVDKDNL